MSDSFDRLKTALADRYVIEQELGAGGMATVYLAEDLKHHRKVAVKVLRAELSASIGTERFNREIEIAARLQHPHILPVHDSGDADGVLFYVMPHVEGESLKEVLARGAVPADEALRIVREVANALDYAHREGVVHRDIKPANILLSQGHAVVADFGIARAVSDVGKDGLTQIGMAVGTPSYMSPEQATADPNVDGRTDIYALGCVLYELLEGKPPFDGETAQAIIAKTISSPVPQMQNLDGKVPDTVPAAIERALAKDPNERYQTAGEFSQALEVSLGELLVGTRPVVRRVVWAPVVAAAVLVVMVVALVVRGSGSKVAAGADVIAVLPFDISGASAELGEGMVNLLSTNLNAVGAIRTVDARTVLQRWRSRGGEDGLDLEGSLQVGRDANAGSILLGSVVAVGDGVRLNAEMYTTQGEELARVQIDGATDNVFQLIDSLSLEILRTIWRSNEPVPSFDVAAITTGSLDAVRAYMRGTLHFRRGQWDSAVAAFQQATTIDSTFALAHLVLAEAYGWSGRHGSDVQARANATAFRFADRLPARERLLVQAYHLNRQNDRTSLDSIRRYTQLYPSNPRGWYALGDFQYHGMTDGFLSPEEQLEPFDRALALDSSMVAAMIHPMEISLLHVDRERFERYFALNEAAGGDDRGYDRVAQVAWGSTDEARDVIDSLFTGGIPVDIAVTVAVLHNPAVVPYALDAFAPLAALPDPDGTNFRYRIGMIALLVGDLDRLESTLGAFEAAGQVNLEAFVRMLAVFGGVADASFADSAVQRMTGEQSGQAVAYANAVLALTRARPSEARAFMPDDATLVGDRRHRYRGVDGWALLLEGDTARGIQQLRVATDSIAVGTLVAIQVRNTFRFQLARALAARRETQDEGIRMLRYGFDVRTAPELWPARSLAIAEALEWAGDMDGAAVAYADFISLWENAHPSLQPRVENARRALERVMREAN